MSSRYRRRDSRSPPPRASRSPYDRRRPVTPPRRTPSRRDVTPSRSPIHHNRHPQERRRDMRSRHEYSNPQVVESRSRSRPRNNSPFSFNQKNLPKTKVVNNSYNFSNARKNINVQGKKSGMFDSKIWEQWNFERKLDQAPKITNKPSRRYYSAPGHLNEDPRHWSGELKREVFDEIMRNVVLMNMASQSNFQPMGRGGGHQISAEHQRNLDMMFDRLRREGAMMNHNNNNFEAFDYYGKGDACKCGSGCKGSCRFGNSFRSSNYSNQMSQNPRFANFNRGPVLRPPPMTPMYGGFGGYNNTIQMVRAGNARDINNIGRSTQMGYATQAQRSPSPSPSPVSNSYHMPQNVTNSPMNQSKRYKNSHSTISHVEERPYNIQQKPKTTIIEEEVIVRRDRSRGRVTPERTSFYDPRGGYRESVYEERRPRRDLSRSREMRFDDRRGYY